MTPQEALESLETFGGQPSVPQIHAEMGTLLDAGEESRNSTPGDSRGDAGEGDSTSGDKGLADAA